MSFFNLQLLDFSEFSVPTVDEWKLVWSSAESAHLLWFLRCFSPHRSCTECLSEFLQTFLFEDPPLNYTAFNSPHLTIMTSILRMLTANEQGLGMWQEWQESRIANVKDWGRDYCDQDQVKLCDHYKNSNANALDQSCLDTFKEMMCCTKVAFVLGDSIAKKADMYAVT